MTDASLTQIHARLTRSPRPVLTWYGDAGERVELTGPALAQWLSKSANLLVEELDAGPGYRVLVDLPGHWRAVVWGLAAWRVGACVVVGAHDEADAVLTTSPSSYAGRSGVVAVALPALARSFPDPLPDGVIDGSTVLAYGDALGYVPATDPEATALDGPSGTATYADLVRPRGPEGRVLLDGTAGPLDGLLRGVLDTLAAGGSVVLVGGGYADQLRADDERRARLVATERVTA